MHCGFELTAGVGLPVEGSPLMTVVDLLGVTEQATKEPVRHKDSFMGPVLCPAITAFDKFQEDAPFPESSTGLFPQAAACLQVSYFTATFACIAQS